MSDLKIQPVTTDNWDDLEALFSNHGNPNYCWCMRWRLRSREFQKLKSVQRKSRLQSLVSEMVPVGILGYQNGKPVVWCSIAPPETLSLLERSTTLKRIDDAHVWSVVCFFLTPRMRGQGHAVSLLQSAVEYAASQGASINEGYPVEPDQSYRFMGSHRVFEEVGFKEAAVARNGRRIVRLYI